MAAIYDAPYILYAYTAMALEIGLSQKQIASASKAEVPTGLTSSELVAYQTTLELAAGRRQFDRASWGRCFEVLGGREGRGCGVSG